MNYYSFKRTEKFVSASLEELTLERKPQLIVEPWIQNQFPPQGGWAQHQVEEALPEGALTKTAAPLHLRERVEAFQ